VAYARFLSIQEWEVLGLFAAGIVCNALYTHLPSQFIALVASVGLAFEYATRSLWTYNKNIQHSPFTIHGVNLLLGLGWVGLILLGLGLSKFLSVSFSIQHQLIAVILGIGVVGNIIEQLYLHLHIFTYNTNKKIFRFPFNKLIMIYGIPLSVRLGYFTSHPLIIYLLLKLTT